MSESHPSAATPYLAMAQRFASVVPHVAAMGIEVVAASVAKTTLKLPWQAKLVGNQDEGFSLCFRSHQMLIALLRSRHGFRTVPCDVRELLDLGK